MEGYYGIRRKRNLDLSKHRNEFGTQINWDTEPELEEDEEDYYDLYPLAKGFFGEVSIDNDFEELIGTSWEIFAELNTGEDGKVWTNITNVRKLPNTSKGTFK